MKTAKAWHLFLAALILILFIPLLSSATYPEKPVNIIIAFTAGGSSDVQVRIMQKYWNKYVDRPWVVHSSCKCTSEGTIKNFGWSLAV